MKKSKGKEFIFWTQKNKTIRKSHPNSTRFNNLLIKKLADANKIFLDLQSEDRTFSSQQIKKEITQPLSNKSFNEVSRIYLKELEDNNKLTRLSSDKARINHLIKFANSEHLLFTRD